MISALRTLWKYLRLEFKKRRSLLDTPARFIPLRVKRLSLHSLFKDPSDSKIVFEIGSSNGDDTLRLLEAFPEATLHCFEIDSRAIKEWESKVPRQRAHLHKILVSKSSGMSMFYESYGTPPDSRSGEFPDGWHFSGSIREPLEHSKKYPWVKFRLAGNFPTITLDDFCLAEQISPEDTEIGLIWMDVQGAEGDVVSGGPLTLSRTRFVYAEYSDVELYSGQVSLKSLCRLLPGFRIKKIWSDDVLFENRRLIT